MKLSPKLTLESSELNQKFAFSERLDYFVSTIDETITIYFDSIFQMTLKMEGLMEAEERGFVYAWDKFDEEDLDIVNFSKNCKIDEFKIWVKQQREIEYQKYLSDKED